MSLLARQTFQYIVAGWLDKTLREASLQQHAALPSSLVQEHLLTMECSGAKYRTIHFKQSPTTESLLSQLTNDHEVSLHMPCADLCLNTSTHAA